MPWVAALFALAGLLAFLPSLFGLSVVDQPEVLDIGNRWIPFAAFIRRCYLSGHFPLWDPHDLCGMPFLAFPSTGSLYLPGVLLQIRFALYSQAASFDIFFHLALAAISAFALLRVAGRSTPAAWIGAVAYAFSGFLFGNINCPPSLHTGAWLPGWYAAAFALLRRPRAWSFTLAAVSLAAMVLGGDLELLLYAVLGLGFELILRQREKPLGRSRLLALAASAGIGALMAFSQLLPALELSRHSLPAAETFSRMHLPGLPAAVPLLALFPIPVPASYAFPNSGLDPWFLGAFLILPAADGLRRFSYVRRRMFIFPAAAIYLILLDAPPFNLANSNLPALRMLAEPLELWPVLELFFLLGATFALDQWAEGRDAAAPSAPLPAGRAGACYLVVFGAATAVSLYWFRRGMDVRLIFSMILVAVGVIALPSQSVLTRLFFRGKSALAIALVVLDLYGLALTHLPRTDPAAFELDPRLLSFLGGTAGNERYQILATPDASDPGLPFHLGLRLNADTIDAFTRAVPARAARRLALLYPSWLRRIKGQPVPSDPRSLRDPQNLARNRLDFLNEMNVTWIVSRSPWSGSQGALKLTPVVVYPDLYLYKNENARPRATAEVWGQPVEMTVRHPAPDQVELDPASFWWRWGIRVLGSELTVRLAESWYPGWEAMRSGREIKIEPDELGFRRLTAGRGGAIILRFAPGSFRIGLWSSLASLFTLLLSLGFWKFSLTKPRR